MDVSGCFPFILILILNMKKLSLDVKKKNRKEILRKYLIMIICCEKIGKQVGCQGGGGKKEI